MRTHTGLDARSEEAVRVNALIEAHRGDVLILAPMSYVALSSALNRRAVG